MLSTPLTPHFTLKEVVDDPEWWDTLSGADQLRYRTRLTATCALAEFFRAQLGPLSVGSGIRSPRVQNSIRGASPTSEHPLGYCLDLTPALHAELPLDQRRSLLAKAIARFINLDVVFDQIIWYPGGGDGQQSNFPFVHLSLRSDQDQTRNRRMLLASTGVGKYAPWASAQTVFPCLSPVASGLQPGSSPFPLSR